MIPGPGKSLSVAPLVMLLVATAHAATPKAAVRGLVTDEDGEPLGGVTVQVCGMEKSRDGAWVRKMRTGMMPRYATDEDGRFLVPFYEADLRYDLWFDKPGFAPTFLYGISAGPQQLEVVMRRGVLVTGMVTRLVEGRQEPVLGTTVEIRLFTEDLWYQGRVLTDQGRYMFAVSAPPKGKKWSVVFLNEAVDLDVVEGEPVAGPDFVVVVQVRVKQEAAQPDAPADADKPRR